MGRLRRVPRRLAILVAVAAGFATAGIVLDLAVDDVELWFRNHAFATAMIGNALVLLVAYAIIDEFLEQREARRWHAIARRPMAEFLAAFDGVRRYGGAAPRRSPLGRRGLDRAARRGRRPHTELLADALVRTRERGATLGHVLLSTPHLAELYEPLGRLLSLVGGADVALRSQMWDQLENSVAAACDRADALADEASRVLEERFAVSATGRPYVTEGPG